MAATANANSNPSTEPTTIPHLVDCTRRANQPLSSPTTIPFRLDPTMIPASRLRAAGVNHAVAPSRAPNTSPKISPIQILFIDIPAPSASYSATAAIPLRAAQKKQKKSHRCVGREQPQHNLIAFGEPPHEFAGRFRVRLHRQLLLETPDVGEHRARILISRRRI